MVTSLDDLIVTLGTDAGMVAGMGLLYGMLRRGMRAMVREEIATAVRDALRAELAGNGQSPREVITELREQSAAHGQSLADLADEVRGVSGRLDTQRTMLFSHIDRGHPRGRT